MDLLRQSQRGSVAIPRQRSKPTTCSESVCHSLTVSRALSDSLGLSDSTTELPLCVRSLVVSYIYALRLISEPSVSPVGVTDDLSHQCRQCLCIRDQCRPAYSQLRLSPRDSILHPSTFPHHSDMPLKRFSNFLVFIFSVKQWTCPEASDRA